MLPVLLLLLQAAPANATPETATPRLRVAVPADGDSQPPAMYRQVELVELLSKDPSIEIVKTRLPSRPTLRDPTAWMPGDDDLYLLYQDYQNSDYSLFSPNGVRLWGYEPLGAEPSAVAGEVIEVLERERWHRALLGLTNLRGECTVLGRFENPSREELELTRGKGAHGLEELTWDGLPEDVPSYRVSSGTRALTAREQFFPTIVTLVVTNPGEDPLYVAVLLVGEDRHHVLLYPRTDAPPETCLLEPGDSVRVPVHLGCNLPWDQLRPMRDRYFLIASRTPQGVSSFRADHPIGTGASALEAWILEQTKSDQTSVEGVGVKVIDLHVY